TYGAWVPRAAVREAEGRTVFEGDPKKERELKRAVCRILESEDGVTILEGRAGASKTCALKHVREAYEAEGYKVVGACIAASAAKNLERASGIRSHTVAKLVGFGGRPGDLDGPGLLERVRGKTKERVSLDERTVLVVDEAGMLGTRAM